MKKSIIILLGIVSLALTPAGAPRFAQASDAYTENNIFVPLAKKLIPSVVNIQTVETVKATDMDGQQDLFRKFFEQFFRDQGGSEGVGPRNNYDDNGGAGNGDDGGDDDDGITPGANGKLPKAMALGTGFIIDSSGLILTNNHVVAGADEIKIQFTENPNEKLTDGVVVGRDLDLDVALIKVKTKRKLVPVSLGDSDATQVGEYVMAVGNPFGQGHSVTHGIISAKGRLSPDFPLAGYIQTDAPINPGNSGGPLVNLKGQVIGINNAIDQRAQGIGFAIPINVVKQILPQLETKGTVSRGYIGVLVNELTSGIAAQLGAPKDLNAPFITHVYPGQPAAKAGLKTYDVITRFNHKAIHSSLDLIKAVTRVSVGKTVPIRVLRNGKKLKFEIKIAKRPSDQAAAGRHRHHKKKKHHGRAHINVGMKIEDMTPELARELGLSEKSKGVVVDSVSYDGPADKAGLTRGDEIIEVDRKPIRSVEGFYSIVKKKQSYMLRVRRMDPQGQESFAVIILNLKR